MQKARLIKSPTKFMAQYFCNGRRMYPLSGLIGFKWKTYSGRYEETAPYDAAWQYIAEHKIPVVWVLRNTLDIIVSDTMHYEQSHDPTVTSFAMTVARNVSKGGSLQLTLAEKLNTMEDAKGKIRRKLKDMGVSHHISAYEMLFHDNAATRLAAWRKMLLFYGATRAADTLTLATLDRFVDSYDKTSAFNNHGNGPPKSRFEVVTNLAEVTAEYKRVMEARRAAGKEAMPEASSASASPDKLAEAESGAEPAASSSATSAKEHDLLGNNAVQFHPNDFESKATAKAVKATAVKLNAVKAVK